MQISHFRIPKITTSLQIPSFQQGSCRSPAWYEDFVLSNARIFVENGISSIKLQDETVQPAAASHQTVARMARLGNALRREFPDLTLGIIVQAHDPVASLAIADACDAHFVRLKVFCGASVASEGLRSPLGPEAVAYRRSLGREDIQIFADVHDRTSVPVTNVPNEMAAYWCARAGADTLVITGSSFEDTLTRIRATRAAGNTTPIVIGGGVSAANIAQALELADGAIVGTTFLRDQAAADSMTRWDGKRIADFMAKVPA